MNRESDTLDIAIVGAGGAGLTAALYAARAMRKTAVFERMGAGGQIATTDIVENFPGFPDGINGFDLSQLFLQQAEKFGAEVRYEGATGLAVEPDGRFRLVTDEGDYLARSVIVTAGADYNKLGVPGEAAFVGKGVSYCATCDGAFFQGQDVIVVGGGDAALDEGEFLTRYANSVTIVHRRHELRASAINQERAFSNPKMRFTWDTIVERIEGKESVEKVLLRNLKTGETTEQPIAGVFIFIGQTPNNHLLKGLVDMDAGGHAFVDLEMKTTIPGLFVAGDLRTKAARQLISACGDGATAAIAAEHYLAGHPLSHGAK
ncbi:MAG: thioredoxin-disulfide reductase [Dehalococcoidia bacterium]|nr:thioredoxin-disulfide reductase [Dehalococcoidia bacterium]